MGNRIQLLANTKCVNPVRKNRCTNLTEKRAVSKKKDVWSYEIKFVSKTTTLGGLLDHEKYDFLARWLIDTKGYDSETACKAGRGIGFTAISIGDIHFRARKSDIYTRTDD